MKPINCRSSVSYLQNEKKKINDMVILCHRHDFQICCVIVKDQYRLKGIQNVVLRRVFGTKWRT